MHAHRINVLDGTHDDGVIRFVADHFHLKLFPAQQAFVDKDLVHGACVHARTAKMHIIFAVVRHTAACTAHGKGRADDGRQANIFQLFQSQTHAFFKVGITIVAFRRSHDGCARVLDTKAVHGFAEQFAVFRHFNRFAGRTDQLNAELFKDTHFLKRQRCVQPGLPAHGGQQGVGAFFFDDLGNNFRRDRLYVGGIGQSRIGHDCRGVRVHQNNPVSFFAQRLAGLGTGVVKFAGLPDDNGASPDDHDGLNVSSFGHGRPRGWGEPHNAGESPEIANCRVL